MLAYQNSLLAGGQEEAMSVRSWLHEGFLFDRPAHRLMGYHHHPVDEVSEAQGHQNQGKESARVRPGLGASASTPWQGLQCPFRVPLCYGAGSCFKGQNQQNVPSFQVRCAKTPGLALGRWPLRCLRGDASVSPLSLTAAG